jgi:hypothetical protein
MRETGTVTSRRLEGRGEGRNHPSGGQGANVLAGLVPAKEPLALALGVAVDVNVVVGGDVAVPPPLLEAESVTGDTRVGFEGNDEIGLPLDEEDNLEGRACFPAFRAIVVDMDNLS